MSKHNGGENIGEAGKSLLPSSVNPGSPSMRVLPPGTGWGAAVGHKLDPYNSPPHIGHTTQCSVQNIHQHIIHCVHNVHTVHSTAFSSHTEHSATHIQDGIFAYLIYNLQSSDCIETKLQTL